MPPEAPPTGPEAELAGLEVTPAAREAEVAASDAGVAGPEAAQAAFEAEVAVPEAEQAALDAGVAAPDPLPELSPRTGATVLGLGLVSGVAASSELPPEVGDVLLPAPPPRVLGAPPRRLDSRRTRQLVALGFVLFVIIVAIASRRGGSGKGPLARPFAAAPGAAASSAPASDLERRAAELLAHGDAAGAGDLLDRELQAPAARNDPRAYLVLGHVRTALGRRADGLAAYERAIILDSALAGDPQLKQTAIKALDTRDVVAAVVALELLASRVQPPAREQILAQASNGKVMEVRHRALAIAQRDGFAEGVDHIQSWSLDLEQVTSCDERRAVVMKLRAAGDKRALLVLRQIRGKFACNDRDVASAISELEARP
jgi:Tfp pilus assembly protein PilF